MEITSAHGHVGVPRRGNAEITAAPFDRHLDGGPGPVLVTGAEGVLHLGTEPLALRCRFVVASAGHASRIGGHRT